MKAYVLHGINDLRLEERRIHPELLITHRFLFESLGQGLAVMRDKTEEYVKIILK